MFTLSSSNKRVESDSLRRRFAPPPLAAHAQRWASDNRGHWNTKGLKRNHRKERSNDIQR